jgi:recombinational DNA repair protein (RecF pathway)
MEDLGAGLAFTRCDICGKPYGEDEKKIRDMTSEYSEEDLRRHEPFLLLCDSCTVDLGVLPTFNP